MSDPVETADPVGLRPVMDPNILRYAALAYVVVLPIGQLLRFPVNGTVVTASDWFLGVVILAGVVELSRMSGHYLRNHGGDLPLLPGMGTFHFAAPLFMAFSAWVALGVVWGAYPDYAAAKGLTFAALALGALAILHGGADWGRVADAWILGTVLCLCVTWVGALVGPEVVRSQVIFGSESIRGPPVPRMSGPFVYPNVFGEYLVVSAALLWARWTGVRRKWGRGASVVAWVLAVTLLLTSSSAWLAAGVLMISFGLLTIRRRQGRPTLDRKRPAPFLFLFGGVVLFTVTLAGLVVPLGVDIAGLSIAGSGLRPIIWASAWDAVKDALIGGVGASPYLATIADPLAPTVVSALPPRASGAPNLLEGAAHERVGRTGRPCRRGLQLRPGGGELRYGLPSPGPDHASVLRLHGCGTFLDDGSRPRPHQMVANQDDSGVAPDAAKVGGSVPAAKRILFYYPSNKRTVAHDPSYWRVAPCRIQPPHHLCLA